MKMKWSIYTYQLVSVAINWEIFRSRSSLDSFTFHKQLIYEIRNLAKSNPSLYYSGKSKPQEIFNWYAQDATSSQKLQVYDSPLLR